MVQFRVRADSLSEVAGLLGGVLSTFDGNLASVDARLQAVVGTTWRGQDADKVAEEWTTFLALAAQVRGALTGLQSGLVAADGSYTQTESGVRTSFVQRVGAVGAVRGGTGELASRVETGEERAEDMAEFFGRDYAGDDEVEQFGGGVVGRRAAGRGAAAGGDTDGDGDDDSIGSGVFLSDANREALSGGEAASTGFDANDDGVIEQAPTEPAAQTFAATPAESIDTKQSD